MAIHRARFDAPVVEEQTQISLDRLIPGAQYGLKVWNAPLVKVTATSLDTPASLWDKLAAALTDTGYTVDGEKVLTGSGGLSTGLRVVGLPACVVERAVDAIAPLGQVFTVQLPASTTGGTFDLTFDFGSGTETATLDANTNVAAMVTELEGLATPGTGDFAVTLLSTAPLRYRFEAQGALLGVPFTVTGDGAALTGTGTCEISVVQAAGDAAKKVQVCWFGGLSTATGELQIRFAKNGVTSGWVSFVNAFHTDGRVEGWIEDAVFEVTGVNKVVVKTLYDQGHGCGGGVFLVNNDNGDDGDVTIESRYFPIGSVTASGYSASTEVLRAAGANESEIVLMETSYAGGFDVEFDGNTETATASSNEGMLQSMWNALAGSGNSTVYANPWAGSGTAQIYAVVFGGTRANANQPTVGVGDGTALVLLQGQALSNQITQIVVTANSGTIRYTANGGTNYTSELAYNESAANLQTALRGLAAIGSGNVNVTGAGTRANPYLVEGVSGLAATSFTLGHDLVADNDLVGGYDPAIVSIQGVRTGVHQQDRIRLDPNRISGYLLPLVNGSPGNRVAYNGNAAAWEAGIETVTSSGCAVTAAGTDDFLVVWDDYAARNLTLEQSQLTVSESSVISLVRLTEATGPNRWNEPLNWDTESVPGYGDTVYLEIGNEGILDGLNQRCSWVRDTRSNDLLLGSSVDDSGDFAVGQKVRLFKGGGDTFPSATLGGSAHTLSTSTDYYVVAFDKFKRSLAISTTVDGAPIEITNSGTGTFEVGVTLAAVYRSQGWEGRIGHSRRENGTRHQERPRALKVNVTALTLGIEQQGSGPDLEVWNLGTVESTVQVEATGSSRDAGEMACTLMIDQASTDVTIDGGQVCIGADTHTALTSQGIIEATGCTLQLRQCSVAKLNLTGVNLDIPFGVTVRDASGLTYRA